MSAPAMEQMDVLLNFLMNAVIWLVASCEMWKAYYYPNTFGMKYVQPLIQWVATDVQITWLVPPRGVLPCVVAEAGRAQRRPPPPLDADDRPRSRAPRRSNGENVEVSLKRNGTEGYYQCSVQHKAGVVLGYPVHWKFASISKQFSRHPENSTASAGTPHVLTCEIQSAPPAAVSWLRNEESLPRDDRYIFLKTQLLITEVGKEDAGMYKCIATNTYLNKTKTSRGGWLRVVDPLEIEPGILPLEDEVDIAVPRFSRVHLLCPVIGWPRPKITWEFTLPDSDRIATLETTSEIVELTSMEFDLEGVYKCLIDDHMHLFKVFNVTITEPVTITYPPVSKDVIRASKVRFNCTATGRPAPTITWYKDGRPLQLGSRFNMRSSVYGNYYELVVGGVSSEDAGVYQCFANNSVSTASSWAVLNVSGKQPAAPPAVRCWPLGRAVLLRWSTPSPDVMAYTVRTDLPFWPGSPHNNTEEIINVNNPLKTYEFQVRAFIKGSGQNVATDMSEEVHCQGQGVPVRILKLSNEEIMVSWKDFVEKTPGVAQWILQYRAINSTHERNITLPGEAYNYTLQVSPEEPIEVRLLGSLSEEWLPQDLSLLPWVSTTGKPQPGQLNPVPIDVNVTQIKEHEFTVSWHYEGPDATFVVCVEKQDGSSKCLESENRTQTVDDLDPDTEYFVEVAAKVAGRKTGGFSTPVTARTHEIFKDLTWKFVNSSTVRVSWNAPPAKYTVSYSSEPNVDLEQWDKVPTIGNTALLKGIDSSKNTYVVVTGYDPRVYSTVKTIPAQNRGPEVQWWWTRAGVGLRWAGAGRVVRYSQNLTRALDDWPALHAAGTTAELTDLDPSLPTYVMVATLGGKTNDVFNIPVRPYEGQSNLYLGLGIGAGVFIACLLAAVAFYFCRRRRRTGSPLRPRRKNVSNEEDDEEAAEMKSVGGRLANGGGSKDAGEPLLNGHVHITENPQSKAPNGKMKKGVMTFDLSRYEDPDTTLETVLDDQSATCDLLDTSRRPDLEVELASNNSFPKLPDDNMNSELTRSAFHSDNSKIQPTLQPNG